MNYKLLTIGNITKICDDNLYYDNKGDISILQWFTFQLYFLLEKLDISTIDPITNLKITRAEIYNILNEKYNGNIDISKYIKTNKNEWRDYGFIKNSILNTYDNRNIGGDILFNPVLNKQKTDIIFPEQGPFFGESSSQQIKLKLKKGTSKKINPNITDTNIDTSKYLDISNSSSVDRCTELGSFKWARNSCYADSILLLIVYRIIFNKNSLLYNIISNFKYTNDIVINGRGCHNKDINNSVILLNSILDNFRSLINKIEGGENFNIQNLLKLLKDCERKFSENFYDGQTHDTTEFLYNIFNLFNIKTQNGNITNSYYFSSLNNNITQLNINSTTFYLDPIKKTNNLGKDFYENKISSIKSSDIQFLKISKESLLNLYNSIPIPKYDPIDILTNEDDYKYDKLLNKKIKKSDKKNINNEKAQLRYQLQDIIKIKEFNDLKDQVAFHLKEGYQIIYTDDTTEEGFYMKENDTSPNALKSTKNLPADIGFRLKYKIDENLLDNNTEDIIIKLDRKYQSSSLSEEHNNIKIIPDEYLIIDNTTYELFGIVVWHSNHYISYYRCENNYYLYDDISPQLINFVGNYDKLIINKYSDTEGIVNTNSRLLYYIRK